MADTDNMRGQGSSGQPLTVPVGDAERAFRRKAPDPHDLVAAMVPLRQPETVFRDLYRRYPEEHPELAHEAGQLQDLFARAGAALDPEVMQQILEMDLSERFFFDVDMDVAIYQHLRYLPACWHTHTFFEMTCVLWGSCTNYVEGQALQMTSGDICILAPGTRHAVSVFSDDTLLLNVELRISTFENAFFGVLADTDILSGFFRHALYGTPSHPYLLFRTTPDDFELWDLLLRAMQEFSGSRLYRRRMVNNILMEFFTILLRKHGDKVVLPELSVHGDHRNAVYLLQYMQQHYTTVTLPELAAFFGYSERQVQRLVTELTGKSFIRNIQEMKLRRAADLLAGTDQPVTRIILDLGYADAGTFRTLFRKQYGMTPTEYRKAHRDGQDRA